MRIIAGTYRGQVIDAPKGDGTRPTTDRVRESVMSSLFSLLDGFDGVHVLDAFAGSGALGIEALSRGAVTCVFNDMARDADKILKTNLSHLNITSDTARVTNFDILHGGIPAVSAPFAPYDLIFCDPPYMDDPDDVLKVFAKDKSREKLSEQALMVYESSAPIKDDAIQRNGFDLLSAKKYGKTYVTYLRLGD